MIKRIVLLTNIMSPYRKFFYDQLYEEFSRCKIDFHVILMARTEPGRNWNYEDYQTTYTILLKHKTVSVGNLFIHINRGLKALYKKLRPDLVICAGAYIFPAVWQTLYLKHKLHYQTWYWSESHLSEIRSYRTLKLKIREKLRRAVYSRMEGFWYAGKFSKEFIEKYASPGASMIFVPNMVDPVKFKAAAAASVEARRQIKRNYQVEQAERILFTPARLSAVKGLLEFLDLYKEVPNREGIVLLIAGDGRLHNTIQDYCVSNQLDVRLLGYKTEREIIELYSIADIVVLPSLSDPNPLTCIEACWCSLPLLLSRHVGNYPEIIQNGKNGAVFSYDDKEKAVQVIDTIVHKDQAWMQKAGALSREVAEEIYDPEKNVHRIVQELIKESIGSHET